ncbi:MAG: hypothetical protein AAFY15_05645, partial [Cyanobacteria bacterium J06648_11]
AVAALTRQFLFAAAPASLSMCVSFASRKRFEAKLTDDLRSLNSPTETLVSEAKSELSTQFAQLTERVETLHVASKAEGEQRDTQFHSFSDMLERVRERADEWERERESLAARSRAVEDLSDALDRTRTSLEGLERDRESTFARLRAIESWQARTEESAGDSEEAIAALQTDLQAELSTCLGDLRQQVEGNVAEQSERSGAIAAELTALQDAIAALQSQQTDSREALAEVSQSFDGFISDSRDRLDGFDTALQAANRRNSERQSQLAQLADLKRWQPTVIAGLDGLTRQMEGDRANLEAAVRSARSRLDSAETQLSEFQNTVRQVSDRLDEVQVEAHVEVQVTEEIESLRRNVDEAISENLSEIERDRAAIQSIRNRLDDLYPQIQHIAERQPPERDERELKDINLGIDFGTSFTKVCLRDIAQERSEIITFDLDTPNLDNALLPTTIGVLKDGRLVAGVPLEEWQAYEPNLDFSIEFIKMRLAELDLPTGDEAWRLDRLEGLEDPVTVENLCAFYLSQAIERSRQWIRTWRSELIENYRVRWSANIGVPAQYCDSPALKRFEYVLGLAWVLSESPVTEPFRFETLDAQMMPYRQKLSARANRSLDCHAVPEIAAEVWSFIKSDSRREGHYAFY